VVIGSSTTSSTPKTVRAICPAIVTNPCPTSDVANSSVAMPFTRRQRAVEKSSNDSEYMRFLIATPHPTPRRMLGSIGSESRTTGKAHRVAVETADRLRRHR
jgi:hypothetical protein